MKTKSLLPTKFLFAAACCGALSLTAALADHGADDNQQGGEIEGIESCDAMVLMTPTTAAPANSSIRLELEAEDENGTTAAKLKLETRSLPAATYGVQVTLKSNGSTVPFGTFTVDAQGESEIEFGDEGASFPANVNAFDIATVSITDANGTVLFTADLTNINKTNVHINANVQATPGAAVPNATGSAVLSAFTSNKQVKGSLQFTGRGLPAKTPVTVLVNGIAAKSLKTDNKGAMSLKLGPSGKAGTIVSGVTLLQVKSEEVRDRSGNVLLKAGF
jgi:hypothetical protein